MVEHLGPVRGQRVERYRGGVLVGVGYETVSHLSFEGSYGYGSPDTGESGIDQNVGTFMVSISGLWY